MGSKPLYLYLPSCHQMLRIRRIELLSTKLLLQRIHLLQIICLTLFILFVFKIGPVIFFIIVELSLLTYNMQIYLFVIIFFISPKIKFLYLFSIHLIIDEPLPKNYYDLTVVHPKPGITFLLF